MNEVGKKTAPFASIVMVLGAVMALGGLLGIYQFAKPFATGEYTWLSGDKVFVTLMLVGILSTMLQLATGVLGVANAKKPQNAKYAFITCVCYIAVVMAMNITMVAFGGELTGGALIGFAIPLGLAYGLRRQIKYIKSSAEGMEPDLNDIERQTGFSGDEGEEYTQTPESFNYEDDFDDEDFKEAFSTEDSEDE